MANHRMAQPCHLVATWRWWQMDNLSEVDVFWGDPFSTDRFRPDGLKERAKGIRGRKIFRPYGKSVGFITPSRHRRCKRMRGSSEMMKRRRRAFMLNTLRDPSEMVVAVCRGKKGGRTLRGNPVYGTFSTKRFRPDGLKRRDALHASPIGIETVCI